MAESSRPGEANRPVLAATPARQGRYGRHLLVVLVISTILAAIGLGLAWMWKAPAMSAEDARLYGRQTEQPAKPSPTAQQTP
jgi:hypothetical protein